MCFGRRGLRSRSWCYGDETASSSANRSIKSEGRAIGIVSLPDLFLHLEDRFEALSRRCGQPKRTIHVGLITG